MTRKKKRSGENVDSLIFCVFYGFKVSVIRAVAKSTRQMSDDELISISNAGYRCQGWFPEFSLKGCPLALILLATF